MIKVITSGDLELFASKIKQPQPFTCPACGCEFEADREDYQTYISGSGPFVYSCECPCCKSKITTF